MNETHYLVIVNKYFRFSNHISSLENIFPPGWIPVFKHYSDFDASEFAVFEATSQILEASIGKVVERKLFFH